MEAVNLSAAAAAGSVLRATAALLECDRAWTNASYDADDAPPTPTPTPSQPQPHPQPQPCEHAPVLTQASAVRAAVLAALTVLSLAGNLATIASIRRSQRERRCHGSLNGVYALILHLSVADLLVSAFCIGGEAAWSYSVEWLAGNAMCKVFKFLQMFSLYLSTFVLVLIGVDRFVVVRYPMRSLSSAKRLNKLIAFVWVLSLVLSVPQLVIFHLERGPFVEEFYQCVTYGFYTEHWQEQLYTTFSLVCMFILPLIIIISTYVSTIITIARSERQFRIEVATGDKSVVSDVNRRRLIHRAKMKSLRISVVIVIAFILWWMPYYTMMIIFMFLDPDEHISEDMQSWIFFFGMSNSLVNPIIYGAFHLRQPKRNCSSRSTYSENRQSFRNDKSLHRITNVSRNVGKRPENICEEHMTSKKWNNHNGITRVSSHEVGSNSHILTEQFLRKYQGVISMEIKGVEDT